MKWLFEYEYFPAKNTDKKAKPSLSYGYALEKILFSGKSEYQDIDVIENPLYGRALFLDHLMMTTERDEFIYHELLSHISAIRVNKPERALIIGGGDGGIARELCKYPSIKEIIVAEIDEMVINTCRKFLPSIAKGFDDPRVKIEITDGAAYVENQPDSSFDLILVDSTDPIGPGLSLYQEKFYKDCSRKLKEGGQFSVQGLGPFIQSENQKMMFENLKKVFSWVKPYMGVIPTYPTALWLFFHSSKTDNNTNTVDTSRLPGDTKYLTRELLQACYAVPKFVSDQLSC